MICRSCESPFKPTRNWQIFCCNSCKRGYNYVHKEICFYCGETGINRDHIHPVSVRDVKRSFNGQETVYACQECNSLLSDGYFSDVVERIRFLIEAFTKRHNLNKPSPKWDKEELEELGHSLKMAVKAKLKEHQDAERRLLYMQAVAETLIKSLGEEV